MLTGVPDAAADVEAAAVYSGSVVKTKI